MLRGQVLDPDGKPVAGAAIYVQLPRTQLHGLKAGPRTAREGGARRPVRGRDRTTRRVPGMAAPGRPASAPGPRRGRGTGVRARTGRRSPSTRSDEPITLTLRRDDVPIEGRIVSLEGRPIPGVLVSLELLKRVPATLLDAMRRNGGRIDPTWHEFEYGLYPGRAGRSSRRATDADGRFRMTGLGRDRAALLRV